MSTQRDQYNALIDPIIRDLMITRQQIDVQDVIEQLQDFIVDRHSQLEVTDQWKNTWTSAIKLRANELNVAVSAKKPNWKNIESRIQKKVEMLSAFTFPNPSKKTTSLRSRASSTSQSTRKKSSSLNSLRVSLTEDQKKEIPKMLDGLDSNKFWILESTKEEAQKENKVPLSVEEKMKNFAAKCNYVHPCHSLILDVDDENWTEEFSKDELKEIRKYGTPLLRELPTDIDTMLNKIFELESAVQAYNFGRFIEHDPLTEPNLVWFSQTLTTTAKFFVKDAHNIDSFAESDALYYLWSFLSTVFHGSSVTAIGKEKSSEANAAAQNAKRKLSAVESIENKKMGRRMDTIYSASHIELGCLEIGKSVDGTKEFKDSMMKMPIVLKDMLIDITTRTPDIIHDIHILGYNINGRSVSLLDADVPNGYVTRIRRTNELEYPTSSDDYVQRMVPLLNLALQGKMMVEETLYKYRHTRTMPMDKSAQVSPLPPCFNSGVASTPSASVSGVSVSPTSSSCTAESSDSHMSKRQR